VLSPGDRRRAEVIMLLSGAEAKGILLLGRMPQGQVLLPGNRRRAEVINVLLPGNVGDESKGNAVITTKITKKMLLLERRL